MSNKAKRYREMRKTLGSDHPDTREAFDARLTEALEAEMGAPEPGLWWLSFTDPSRPAGSRFLGVAIVEAIGSLAAITTTHVLGINPGGQVAAWGPSPVDTFGPEWQNRLLTREEAESIQE